MSEPQQTNFEGWAHEAKLAYFAGLFDGEGCVSISRKKSTGVSPSFGLNVSVANCHFGVLVLLKQMFGRKNQRDWFAWQLSGGEMAADFIRSIRPYSIIKAEQIDLALEFAGRVTRRSGYRLSLEEIESRASYKLRLSTLKGAA